MARLHQINEQIRDKEIRLIGPDGEQMGIVSVSEALEIAADRDLDLVKIAPQAVPPACRIMDYGKYRFEESKREKEAKKRQHVVEVKEIRLSPGIDIHDFNTKLKNARKFLADGNKVKVGVRFRGRELAHISNGDTLLKRFAAECEDIAVMERPPRLEGRHMSIHLQPKTQANK